MNEQSLRVAGKAIPDAADSIRRYCGLGWSGGRPEVWAYEYFDLVPSVDPDVVDRVDVLSAAALHPGLSRADLAFFLDSAGKLTEWLRSVPADCQLAAADDSLVDVLGALADFDAVSLTLLTKVMHRKRPGLIPLLDRHVIDWYRPVTGERSAVRAWLPLLRAIRADLAGIGGEDLIDMRSQLGIEMSNPPSDVRLLDIAIWMVAQR